MAADYQHASDAVEGHAFSGVIRADGRWIAVAHDSPNWDAYVVWRDTMGNVTDPYKPPLVGGVAIVLQPDEVAYGAMLDSLPGVGPPVNVDVPAAGPVSAAVGDILSCTTGNWQGEPTGYTYEWMSGGAVVGVNPSYPAQPVDVGNEVMCVVTAHNAHGATAAPPSNAVTIVAAVEAAAAPAVEQASASPPPPPPPNTRSTTGSGTRSR